MFGLVAAKFLLIQPKIIYSDWGNGSAGKKLVTHK